MLNISFICSHTTVQETAHTHARTHMRAHTQRAMSDNSTFIVLQNKNDIYVGIYKTKHIF